jgi:hypothetical protein
MINCRYDQLKGCNIKIESSLKMRVLVLVTVIVGTLVFVIVGVVVFILRTVLKKKQTEIGAIKEGTKDIELGNSNSGENENVQISDEEE